MDQSESQAGLESDSPPQVTNFPIYESWCDRCKRTVCGKDVTECPVCLGSLTPPEPV